MTSWSFLIIAALAGLLRQRHFQTYFDHCQNTSCFDILSKATIQTKFPNALFEILQACFFISLLCVPISTDSMAIVRCLIRLDLIDIYHRLILKTFTTGLSWLFSFVASIFFSLERGIVQLYSTTLLDSKVRHQVYIQSRPCNNNISILRYWYINIIPDLYR